MSKQRANDRTAREAAAAAAQAESAEQTEREKTQRARKDARAARWRRLRLWQRSPSDRHRDTRRTLIVVVLLLLLLAYLFTRSFKVVVGMAILLTIASPVLIKMSFDRNK